LRESVDRGLLSTTSQAEEAVRESDIAVVCVGTPSDHTGAVSLDHVRSVLTSIARSVRGRTDFFVVVLRSTVLPNILEEELLPIIERESGKSIGRDIGVCYNPEFLREGNAIRDFYDPPLVIVGANDNRSGAIVSSLYHSVNAAITRSDLRTAAMVKYTCNMFHALKVTFANEIARIAEAMDVDAHALMDIVCQDRKLNIAPTYLKPGLAFGGSCLPKDLRAVLSETRRIGLRLPLIDAVAPSNEAHLRSCIDTILRTNCRNLGLIGLTFKEGTDDLRESPAVAIAETLIGKGCNVTIYEPAIAPGSIYGRNLEFAESSIPHLWKLLSSHLPSVLEHSEIVVVLKKLSETERACFSQLHENQTCLDFVNTLGNSPPGQGRIVRFGGRLSEVSVLAAA
jgi:GDP-mannose 6-dehydrogenase